jgi:hypothetical protein
MSIKIIGARLTNFSSRSLAFGDSFLLALLILPKQPHLVKAVFFNLKRQGEVTRTLEQKIGHRLFAVTQTL